MTNCTCPNTIKLSDDTQCWPGIPSVDRMLAYRLCVMLFAVALGPFFFFNVQKTTALQVVTTLLRWVCK